MVVAGGLVGTVTATVKANISRLHFQAAEQFLRRCEAIEADEMKQPWPQPHWDESRNLVSAIVMMSVAALEASINEFYLEAVDGNTDSVKPLQPHQRTLLATLWDEVDQLSILKKYEIVLASCSAAPLERGSEPYQSAAALVELRNALVHFKPEWDHELERHAKLEKRLKAYFEGCKLAAMAQGRMVWFPHQCLGAGCGRWAVTTVRAFASGFTDRLGIPARFPAAV